MLSIIKEALEKAGVSVWQIHVTEEESAELYFILHHLDMHRMKHTKKYLVTVYRDFEKNGKAMRGSSTAHLTSSYTKEEVENAIKGAYYAASFVANPTYRLPDAAKDHVPAPAQMPVEDSALLLAEALMAGDCDEVAFVNSAEIFSHALHHHILSYSGTDITFSEYAYKGEFVAQCKTPTDVEMHHQFSYSTPDANALTAKVTAALRRVKDRAKASPTLKGGQYTLLLSEDYVATLFDYYLSRSDARSIYAGYSAWKVNEAVQDSGDGEDISLSLVAKTPYSPSGIPMIDRPLVEKNVLRTIHGSDRFCAYLGIEMTGDYRAFSCDCGSVALADMQKEPHLYVVSFSDFQMDAWTGHFGGEIRLAYYFDGKDTHVITGGSVNGNFADCKSSLKFSEERYQNEYYSGPFAVSLPGVSVAGQENQ
ncbi:MAG: hypothetical protein J6R42_04650 [Clostridia bacterium]|nr:hypothetical protein [Clostridia bacterium]